MNRIFYKILVFVMVVVFSGISMNCSGPSKKDSTKEAPQHGHGGGCGH